VALVSMGSGPTFFHEPGAFRAWLEEHHGSAAELLVGFYKRGSGLPSITWPESVDEALCFGWIDGIRRRIDERSYSIRFTPRRAGSTWSAVNMGRMEALLAEGRVRPAGAEAFAARTEARSGIYAYEQGRLDLAEPYQSMLRENGAAWDYFHAQPPSYRKVAIWWVLSAKGEATRVRRAEQLIADSAAGRRIRQTDWKRETECAE